MSAILLLLLLGSPTGWGTLPQPDAVLFGSVIINGTPATGDITVIARAPGAPEPVGTYRFGECVQEEIGPPCPPPDTYLLQIRTESLEDDPSQLPSVDAARVGQTVMIFIQVGEGPEMFAADFPLTDRGLVMELDLSPAETPDAAALFSAALDWYLTPNPLLPPGLLALLESLRMMSQAP